MSKLTELERLKKSVVDTKDACDDAHAATDAAWGAADAWDADAAAAAWAAYRKALQELEEYLKEQDND